MSTSQEHPPIAIHVAIGLNTAHGLLDTEQVQSLTRQLRAHALMFGADILTEPTYALGAWQMAQEPTLLMTYAINPLDIPYVLSDLATLGRTYSQAYVGVIGAYIGATLLDTATGTLS